MCGGSETTTTLPSFNSATTTTTVPVFDTTTTVPKSGENNSSTTTTSTTTVLDYEYNKVNIYNPPYGGTIFITGNLITDKDPSTFDYQEYKGTNERTMFDRRDGGKWIDINAHIFDTYYFDEHYIEVQVNTEFSENEAREQAQKYGWLIGQLPKVLKRDVSTVWIHKGLYPWGGGNNNLLFHIGQTQEYENFDTIIGGEGSIVEETLIHEAAHTSIDSYFYGTKKWEEAVEKDNNYYFSTYGEEYPDREDIAEIFPLYIAVKFFPERINQRVIDEFLSTSLSRVELFDSEDFDFSIYEP